MGEGEEKVAMTGWNNPGWISQVLASVSVHHSNHVRFKEVETSVEIQIQNTIPSKYIYKCKYTKNAFKYNSNTNTIIFDPALLVTFRVIFGELMYLADRTTKTFTSTPWCKSAPW